MASAAPSYCLNSEIFRGEHAPRALHNAVLYSAHTRNCTGFTHHMAAPTPLYVSPALFQCLDPPLNALVYMANKWIAKYLATYWYTYIPSHLLSWGLLDVVALGTAGVELETIDWHCGCCYCWIWANRPAARALRVLGLTILAMTDESSVAHHRSSRLPNVHSLDDLLVHQHSVVMVWMRQRCNTTKQRIERGSGHGLISWSHDITNFAHAKYSQAYDLVSHALNLLNRALHLVNRAYDLLQNELSCGFALIHSCNNLLNCSDDIVNCDNLVNRNDDLLNSR